MEDQILGQSNQATNLKLQISIKTDFPQSVLISNINHEFTISIVIDRVPRSVPLVVIFFPFLEDKLWQACLGIIKCVPIIPHHFHYLIITIDDEVQKKTNFTK